jgi:hypothetical protein
VSLGQGVLKKDGFTLDAQLAFQPLATHAHMKSSA